MSGYKFGTYDFCYPVIGPAAFELAGAAGYDGVCICDLGGAKRNLPLLQKRIQEMYLEAARQYGVTIQGYQLLQMNHPKQRYEHFSPGSPEGELGRLSVSMAAEICAAMKIPFVKIETTGMFDGDDKRNVLENYKAYARICEEAGVRLLIETDMTLTRLCDFLDSVGHGLRACVDTSDILRYGTGDPARVITSLGRERIGLVQMKDSRMNRYGYITARSDLAAPLGQGDSRLEEAARAVRDIGYDGWIFAKSVVYLDGFAGQDYIALGKSDVAALRRAYLS